MKYFFIAGERSGDQHAARVISALQQKDHAAEIRAWGGDYMQSVGAKLLKHYKAYSVMGFWEVLLHVVTFRRLLIACKQDISQFNPDVLILVDFAGFNLRMASFAKKAGIKVSYYISPKTWAWQRSRIQVIKSCVDQMLVILPFEQEFYKSYGYEVVYVGNPTYEQVSSHQFDLDLIAELKAGKEAIAFLPGSRRQEIIQSVEVIAQLADIYEDHQFLVAGVDNADPEWYEPLMLINNIHLFYGKTYELLRAAEVAIVTSGTATLEAALLGTPQVVVYKTSWLTYWLAKMIAKVKYISLVNLIGERNIVPELIQGDFNAIDLSAHLEKVLTDEDTKKRVSEGYSEIRSKIGKMSASENAAKAIYKLSRQ